MGLDRQGHGSSVRTDPLPTFRAAMKRRGRLACWLGSIGLAVAGVAGAGSANAANSFTPRTAAPPTYTYSSNATAIGLQVQLAQNPEITSVPDLFDIQTPSSDAHLDSFGTSEASGHVGNLNGLGQLPSLVCLAAGGACNQLPISTLTGGLITSFPPPDPLDAHATYPANQTASAPALGSKAAQIQVNSKGLSLGAGTASATAHALSATTVADDGHIDVAGAISIGSVRTSTSQVATATELTTTATSDVSNINIGGKLLHIGAANSSVTVHSRPGQKATDTATSKVAGVSVLGLAATIDAKGIHVEKLPGTLTTVTNAVQGVLNKLLKAAGLSIETASIHRTDNHSGHTVSIAGLALVFKHTVTGTPPVTIGLPAGIPCPIEPITSKLPVDPCAGLSLSLNAKYRGTIGLGEIGVVTLASPGGSGGGVPGGGLPGGSTNPGGGTVPSGGSTGSTGSAGIPGGPGVTPGGSSSSGSGSQGPPPAVAGKPRSVSDQLAGASRRMLWFFPLIMIGLLAIGGRFRVPARLPRK